MQDQGTPTSGHNEDEPPEQGAPAPGADKPGAPPPGAPAPGADQPDATAPPRPEADQPDASAAGPPSEPPQAGGAPNQESPGVRRVHRSRSERMLAGVCGGLAEHFSIDPILVRIAAVALVLAGGAGVVLYVACVLLIPEAPAGTEPQTASAGPRDRRGLVLVAVVIGLVVLVPLLIGPLFVIAGVLVPVALLVLAGLGTWWVVSGQGAGGRPREVLTRSGLGIAVLIGLGAIAVAAAAAAGFGGGVAAGALVAGAGLGLVMAAFLGRARWLALPALAVALPVAFVTAAGINLRGGFGERTHRPSSPAEVRSSYDLGMGRLLIDLRNAALPPGDTPLNVELGVGEAVVLVADGVCVATRSHIGLGGSRLFDEWNGGPDLREDRLPRAPAGTPRVVVDAHVGVGALQVGRREVHRPRGRGADRGRGGDRGQGADHGRDGDHGRGEDHGWREDRSRGGPPFDREAREAGGPQGDPSDPLNPACAPQTAGGVPVAPGA